MAMIINNVVPTHKGLCVCPRFLEPLTNWEDIAERAGYYSLMRPYLQNLMADQREDWSSDLFRCKDCGGYWIREDCGLTWMTRSLPFFYFLDVGDHDPGTIFLETKEILDRLNRNSKTYKTFIEPLIAFKKD